MSMATWHAVPPAQTIVDSEAILTIPESLLQGMLLMNEF